jgi:hypothetical protein
MTLSPSSSPAVLSAGSEPEQPVTAMETAAAAASTPKMRVLVDADVMYVYLFLDWLQRSLH